MSESDNSKTRRDWNAMIYLAGENNLADECVFALKELKRARPRNKGRTATDAAVDARVKVVAQLDAGGLGGNEVRYVLRRGDLDGELNNDEITRIDTTETSYRGVLKDFISSSILIRGRAKHYLLVLSGHGNGLISDFLSRDIDTPDKLSIPKIRWVLREVKKDFIEKFGPPENEDEDFKIDILGLDSCMMSMAEIGYELRHYVKYMVGAEGFEPNSGWPYERILSDLLTDSDIKPEAFAAQIVDRYVRYYTDFLPAARSVDLSACNLTRFEELASAIKELADVLYDKINEPDSDLDWKPTSDSKSDSKSRSETIRQIVLAHWEAQSYKDDQYVDLYDFCDLLDRGPDENPERPKTGSVVMRDVKVDEDIVGPCRKIKKILTGNGKNGGDPKGDKPMILRSRHSGPAVQFSHGLSVYFPWSNVIDSYEDLEFATDTNWKRFLDKYVEVTRRSKRPCSADMESVQVVEGQLFFNPVIAGFDFLLSENKNAPTVNRFLSNKVGGMKNPAIDHVVCKYPDEAQPGEDEIEEKAVPPVWQETQVTQEKPTTENGETSVKASVESSNEPIARRNARKK